MNVLYVDVDSLRPDHIGAYGYGKPTTPRVDEFADGAVRFDRAYVANSPCMPSRAALVSGRYGVSNGVETHGPQSQVISSPHAREHWDGDVSAVADWMTLPEVFFQARLGAVAVSSFPRHPSPWFYHLWDEYHHPREPAGPGEYFQTPRAADVTDRALSVLDRVADGTASFGGDDGGLLYVQYWDPHAPYNREDAEVEQFRGGDLPPYPTDEQLRAHRELDAWRNPEDPDLAEALRHSEHDAVTGRDALGELLAHYDAEVSYVDRHVGRLLDALAERGLYEDALVVVTADHGEEFGEHGLYREHWSTHDGTQRVPFLVKPPAGAGVEPSARDALVTNVDAAPTLVDYAGIDHVPDAWQGRSLRPVLEDPGADWRDRVVLDHGLYTAQRAVRADRWKFVRTYDDGEWDLPDRALFDVDADPWEQENVADERPEVVGELEREMAAWVEAHVGPEGDPLREVARTGPAGLWLYR